MIEGGVYIHQGNMIHFKMYSLGPLGEEKSPDDPIAIHIICFNGPGCFACASTNNPDSLWKVEALVGYKVTYAHCGM